MKKFIYLTVVFVLLVVVACNRIERVQYQDKSGHTVDEEHYSNGRLKSKTQRLNEAGTDYIYTSYYDDGTMMDSMVFADEKLEGVKTYYDQASGLTHIEHYLHGIMQGENKAVYDNGVTSYQGFRQNGQKAGEWEFHYPDGRPITYEFYDSTGRLKYFRKYDENGAYQNSDGSVLIDAKISAETISIGDTVILQLLVARPPGCATKVEVKFNQEGMAPETIYAAEPADVRVVVPLLPSSKGTALVQIDVKVDDRQDDHTETANRTFNMKVVK